MPARYAILGLLAQHPMHGYEIDREFEAGLRAICHVNISQIYAYLKSLEERGWVRSEIVYQQSNPPKKVYHLTAEGRAHLLEWLAQPVERERQIRDEFLTKIFFCRHLAPDALRDLVAQQKEIHRARLNQIAAEMQEPMDLFTRLLYEAGLRHARADVEWLEWVEEQLENPEGFNPVPPARQSPRATESE